MSILSKSYFRGYISTIWKDHLPIHWTNPNISRSWPKCRHHRVSLFLVGLHECFRMWTNLHSSTVLRCRLSLRTSRESAKSWLHRHLQNWPLWTWRASFNLSRGRHVHIHVKRRNSRWLSLNFSYNRQVLCDTAAFQSIKIKIIPALAYHFQKCSYLLCNT